MPIASPAPKPVGQEADFAESGVQPVVAPSGTLKANGFATGQLFAASNQNWFLRTIGRWIAYLRDFELFERDWAERATFRKNVYITAGGDNVIETNVEDNLYPALNISSSGGVAIQAGGTKGNLLYGNDIANEALKVDHEFMLEPGSPTKRALLVVGSDRVASAGLLAGGAIEVRPGSVRSTSGGALSSNALAQGGVGIDVLPAYRAPGTKYQHGVRIASAVTPSDTTHPVETGFHGVTLDGASSIGFTGIQSVISSSKSVSNALMAQTIVGASGTFKKVAGTLFSLSPVASSSPGFNCMANTDSSGVLVVEFPKPFTTNDYQLLINVIQPNYLGTSQIHVDIHPIVVAKLTTGFEIQFLKNSHGVYPYGSPNIVNYKSEELSLYDPAAISEAFEVNFIAVGQKVA